MNSENLTFSILTPTWNRAKLLEKVYSGLAMQSYKNFEWIVADDGSTDNTEAVVHQLAMKADFPIIFIQADRHVGKAQMDNEAIRKAKGELSLWCDSDDFLADQALQRLWDTWNSIPKEKREEYVGMTALAATEEGAITNPFPDGSPCKDVSWNDMVGVYGITGDMLLCARTDLLRGCPFPEVDFVVSESVVWSTIGHHPARLISEVLKVVEYQADGISLADTMAYNRGSAYALAAVVRNLRRYQRPWRIRARCLVNFIRYSFHGEIALNDALKLWGRNSNRRYFYLAFPFALALAVKDLLQGKVRKTHRDFFSAQKSVKITTRTLCSPRNTMSSD